MPGFEALGVPPRVLEALAAMGYVDPTPVQAQALPAILDGKDALVEAQTGSGKTAAFGIPAVMFGSREPGLRVLVLVPTRELARQVCDEIREIGTGSPFRAVAVTGGVQVEKEDRALGGDVRCIVATPGRFLALIEEKRVRLDKLELVVLDEADRMLDMGFRAEIDAVLTAAAARKQTVLVSATLPRAVIHLATAYLREPVEVHAGPRELPQSLSHYRLNVFAEKKDRSLVALLKQEKPQRAIVFVRTRERAAKLSKLLKAMKIDADALQGEMTHDQRRHVFELFRRGITKILVATDIASRGLDVPEMEIVVNYDLPDEPGAYTHRAGRAARLGRVGRVVSFVEPDEKTLRLTLERESGGEWAPYRLDAATIDAVPMPGDPSTAKPEAPAKGRAARAPASRASATRAPPARAPAKRQAPKRASKREEPEPRMTRVEPEREDLPPSRRKRERAD